MRVRFMSMQLAWATKQAAPLALTITITVTMLDLSWPWFSTKV